MTQEVIGANEAGQRFDKYLHKYFREAPSSFLHKMLRKKNITLNGKKADGSEKLSSGDEINFFLAQETIDKFRGKTDNKPISMESLYLSAFCQLKDRFTILYEDQNILLVNKKAGVLTQKSQQNDIALNEAIVGYLLFSNSISNAQLATFKPSVCNRLDRNTGGIVICGKSLAGLQQMSKLLKERTCRKYYQCVISGTMKEGAHLEGFLCKDSNANKVMVYQKKQEIPNGCEDFSEIVTNYRPVLFKNGLTLVEVELITGKTHQIRAHLASIGFPILGDPKYGIACLNKHYRDRYGLKGQLLHAYRLEFPILEGSCKALSERIFTADPPPIFNRIMEGL